MSFEGAGSQGTEYTFAESGGLDSRAVLRPILPGNSGICEAEHDRWEGDSKTIVFHAKNRGAQQAICNVYEDGAWQRVERYHA